MAAQTLGPYCAALCAAEVFSCLVKPSHLAQTSHDYAYAQLSKGRGGRPAAMGGKEGGKEGGSSAEDAAGEEVASSRVCPPKPYAMRMSGELASLLACRPGWGSRARLSVPQHANARQACPLAC